MGEIIVGLSERVKFSKNHSNSGKNDKKISEGGFVLCFIICI